jgi:hypothetical protein
MIGKKTEDDRNFKEISEAKDFHNHLNGWKPLLCDMNDLLRCFK